MDGFAVAVTGNTNVVIDLSLMPNPAAPAITVQPLSQPAAVGADLVLYAEAVGAPAPVYQWRKDGTNLLGATSQVLVRANFQPADAGDYDVVVSNTAGAVTSQVAVVTMMMAPAITSQPQSLDVQTGSMAVFSVTATGMPAPTYQWYFNGTNIANATESNYTIPAARLTDSGVYNVVVANTLGTAVSSNAVLTVHATPAAASMGVSAVGNSVQISIAGVPGDRYAIQWATNLTDWNWLLTNNAPFTFSDTNVVSNRSRFYRALYLP